MSTWLLLNTMMICKIWAYDVDQYPASEHERIRKEMHLYGDIKEMECFKMAESFYNDKAYRKRYKLNTDKKAFEDFKEFIL